MSAAPQFESLDALYDDGAEPGDGETMRMTSEQQQLVIDNLAIVGSVVGSLRKAGKIADSDESMSDGMVALCRAAITFDPERGMPFERFALHKIYTGIADGYRTYNKSRHGKTRAISVMNRSARSLEAPLGSYTTETLGDSLEADLGRSGESVDRIVEQADAQETRERLLDALSLLDDREQQVMLDWAKGTKMTVIAERLGVGESRVSQIVTQATKLLRQHMTGQTEELEPRDRVRAFLHSIPHGRFAFGLQTADALAKHTNVSATRIHTLCEQLAKHGKITLNEQSEIPHRQAEILVIDFKRGKTKEALRTDLLLPSPGPDHHKLIARADTNLQKPLAVGIEVVPHLFTLGALRSGLAAATTLLAANSSLPARERDKAWVAYLEKRVAVFTKALPGAEIRAREAEVERAVLHPTKRFVSIFD